MAKRFIETTIWTQNKWFRKLEPKYKLFWFFILSSCDAVGVWEEDLELASYLIGYEYSMDSLLKVFEGKIKRLNEKKVWVTDFCNFQYGVLKETEKNRPHQSYIDMLKKHSLWIVYQKSINSPKEKDKDTGPKDLDKDKVLIQKIEGFNDSFFEVFYRWLKYKRERGESYKTQDSTKLAYEKLFKYSNGNVNTAIEIIEFSMSNNYQGLIEPSKRTTKTDYQKHIPNWDDPNLDINF